MKAILEFDLPEDQGQYTLATRAGDLFNAIGCFDAELRGLVKYNPSINEDILRGYEGARAKLFYHLETHGVSLDMVE